MSSTSCTNVLLYSGGSIEICQSIEDVQGEVRKLKECDIDRRELELRRQQDALKDQRIAALEKELDLVKRESDLKDRIIVIKDMEIAAQKRAFEDMKEVSDRALKFAETSKKSSLGNWELGGIIGLVAFIAGALLAK